MNTVPRQVTTPVYTSASAPLVDDLIKRFPPRKKYSLQPITNLLAAMGNPQQHLPPLIHVAGSNGKGSTLAYLHAILTAAGYKVHMHTSPHLVDFEERYMLAGRPVSLAYLQELIADITALPAAAECSFFEISTALAFKAFAETPADVVLMETGLGGELDASNVAATTCASVITSLTLEHTEFLGPTLQDIAKAKAGIFRPQTPAIAVTAEPVAREVLAAAAQRLDAPLLEQGRDWQLESTADGLNYRGPRWQLEGLPFLNLAGAHQLQNAGAAIATLEALPQFDIPAAAIKEGLQTAWWPGRLQMLPTGWIAQHLPEGTEVWVDCAHNQAGAETLAAFLQTLPARPVHIIAAATKPRLPQQLLEPLLPLASSVQLLPIPNIPKSYTLTELQAMDGAWQAQADLSAALTHITEASARVVFCGSLYFIGYILQVNGTPPLHHFR